MSNPDKTLAVETDQAIYFFFVYTEGNVAHVTKLIRKGHKGYDQSASLSLAGARKLYTQLANNWFLQLTLSNTRVSCRIHSC